MNSSLKFKSKRLLMVIADVISVIVSILISFRLRFDIIPEDYVAKIKEAIPLAVVIFCLVYYVMGLYSIIWKYAGVTDLVRVAISDVIAVFVMIVAYRILGLEFPIAVYVLTVMISFLLTGGIRYARKTIKNIKKYFKNRSLTAEEKEQESEKKRVMILGVGSTADNIIKEMIRINKGRTPVVAIDENPKLQNCYVHGVPIYGGNDKIVEACELFNVDEIVITIPSASKAKLREIYQICSKTGKPIKTLPSLYDIIYENTPELNHINSIKDFDVASLLGREEIKLDTNEISGFLKNKVVMVTGGGGSIGSELCRQIAKFGPKKLVVYDIYENNAYDLQMELKYIYGDKLDLNVLIGSVRDRNRLKEAFDQFQPQVVFHAAAHKHVPLMEVSPREAIKNNVYGTYNVAKASDEHGVESFVLISTDKAVNPTSVMGATKRVAEMVIQKLSKISKTKFAAVRFGNVLGSNGSVIPLFKKQISHGGPVTVTHKDIVRYFMTIPEAARLVIQAGAMAKGGEIFILDMGQPVKIVDLAKELITLSGYTTDQIKIKFTGLRPGEKMYEELLIKKEDLGQTSNAKILVEEPINDLSYLSKELIKLQHLIENDSKNIDNEKNLDEAIDFITNKNLTEIEHLS